MTVIEKKPSMAVVDIAKIAAGVALAQQKQKPDKYDRKEDQEAFAAHRKAQTQGIIEDNRDKKANRRLRFLYAKAVYEYLKWYSIGCGFLVLFAGWKTFGFSLPDMVLATIVGSTGVSAIGLVGFVVNGLFKQQK